jgi:ribosome-associated protein
MTSPDHLLIINLEISIPLDELEFSFVRSSGPGGQNVNKVNSKAMLRWNVQDSPSITPEMRDRIMKKLANRINHEGEIVITGESFRDQIRNREDCLEKLKEMIAAAAFKPKPRKKTKPSRSSQRKLKENKSKNSDKKMLRKKIEV